jgi:hypothetical protein
MESVQIFCRLATQWVVGGMGAVIGLNYQSLDFLFKLYKTKNRVEVFTNIQLMEFTVLSKLAKENKK